MIRAILGIKPVKVGDLDDEVSKGRERQEASDLNTPVEAVAKIEVTPEYEQVCRLLAAGTPLVFVTGGAGTGKSTLIQYLASSQSGIKMQTAVVAPTGVAALNARGVTIHSLFYLPHRIIQPEDVRPSSRKLFNKLELLIIDEISMVNPNLLDAVELCLRRTKKNNKPFGGVQILLIGDLFQLPPVVPEDEHRALRQLGYRTDFFFSAKGIADCPLVPIFLKRVFRQADPDFIRLLNNLREGKEIARSLDHINARYDKSVQKQEVVLTSTNYAADRRNERELARLTSQPRTYEGSIEGKFKVEKARLPSPEKLVLKPGAQVMFTKNGAGWVNGTVGKVVSLAPDSVQVRIERGSSAETVKVQPAVWEKYEYKFEGNHIFPEVVGRYRQLPLMLGWAVTIHKAQGKTLDQVLIDLGHGAFAAGQVYVALSRVRSIQNLRLARAIREDEVKCHPDVTDFYLRLQEMTQIG